MNPENPNRQHYPALDGLRGIAILLVVFYHNFGFINQFFFGWLGVDLFFVLSGFLITDILLTSVNSPNYLRNFYMRRILRIFPLYYLCLIIFLIILPLFGLLQKDLKYFSGNQWWIWTFLQNWQYSIHPSADAKIFMHFWSLAVEEQFYLVWPFVILWIKNPKKLFFIMLSLLLAVICLRIVLWLLEFKTLNYTSFYTFTRIDGICIGSMLALLHRFKYDFLSRHMPFIVTGLAALNLFFFLLNRSNNFSFPFLAFIGYTTFAVIFGLLVHESIVNKSSQLQKFLCFRPLRFLGKISYGFYIFHWPVYVISGTYLANYFSTDFHFSLAKSRIAASIVATLTAFIISIISYYLFEIKMLKLKERFR